jgi:hypothetical protein
LQGRRVLGGDFGPEYSNKALGGLAVKLYAIHPKDNACAAMLPIHEDFKL